MQDKRRLLIKQILDNVKINEHDCWVWQGGDIYIRGRLMFPQTIMYICKNGPLTDDEIVHTACGDKVCVNPDHLDIKSKKEIIREDIRSKDRGGYPFRLNWKKIIDKL